MFIFYLARQFFFRIKEFLRHWYVGSFFVLSHWAISVLGDMDRTFAWKITWRHFFEPLYQDYNILGYILGFIFRSGRLLIATAVYGFFIFAVLIIYLIWISFPLIALYKIFH